MIEKENDNTVEQEITISKSRKVWNFTKETIETVVVVLVLVILIRNFLGEARWIPSASMRPTLVEGDRLIVEKVSGYFMKPHRGDVVVFYPPQEELNSSPWAEFTRLLGYFNTDTAYIKRVIGLPGDTIEIKDNGIVYINGEAIKEKYKQDNGEVSCTEGMFCGPIVIPKHSYFMMGDNRGNSQDSRFWGFLPENRIIGKAYFRFWPINRIGLIEHPQYNIMDASDK